jgi:steroid delta-isomerase-like uncharacterized protein
MSEEAKSLIRQFYGEVSAGNLGVIDELVADDVIEHEEFPGLEPNKDGVKQFFAMFRSAFPDLRMEADETVSEGELVCVRGTMSGTHQGEFMGIPASGKRFEIRGFDMVRVRDGQVVEHWGVTDMMSMMQQLGAMPEQAPA